MSPLPKVSIVVAVLLLASLPMVLVSAVDSSGTADSPAWFNKKNGAPERTGHLHLEGRGSGKITLAVQGDSLRIPRFASQDGAWHASGSAGDLHGHGLNPTTPMSSHDEDDFTSLLGGREYYEGLRIGKDSYVDAMVELARATAGPQSAISMIMGNPEMEPGDVWKIMSCAVLISAQNGDTWDSKEAKQLRSMGFFSKEDVLNQLGVIAHPSDCSEPIDLDRIRKNEEL